MITSENGPDMSVSTRGVLHKVRQMIPPMLDTFHKGQLGRVAVIGGSRDYTGAPYFASAASAKLGCDMAHVICTPAAAAVIKTYSPNLMVHPLLRESTDDEETLLDPDKLSAGVIEMLPRLHVLAVGPGLGRDPLMHGTVSRVIRAARAKKMPVVMDADALQIVQSDPDLVRGYKEVILTPNVVEFQRLWDSLGLKDPGAAKETDKVESLARALDGVTIVQKGQKDLISNGDVTLVNDLEGGRKRSGGQGDTLTGSVATFLAWRKAYLDGLWDAGQALGEDELIGLAAFGGSAVTRASVPFLASTRRHGSFSSSSGSPGVHRLSTAGHGCECSRLAFLKRGRSLQASDLTDEVHSAFMGLFGDVDGDAGASKL
ncbi:YjeF domain containing protein [Metarhizium album ARSEF 1941]|uniref:ATP-dependent (S)-NAD(P)H-hydrate dehydratase n=1 Tax=Metarhizium album (strain ARSEF 1941) TaxID=1081103 RepID=A0A0B2WN32_METAS|nr:YjeF domain containing protein [Metarhizium album ARSEF 1941]KHN95328.1 YjeF domain containing protein [Metarhizium album ARSEF 1941]